MKNLKIRVNSADESKEAQELFFELGYEKGACSLGSYPAIIVTTKSWSTENYCSTRALGLNSPTHENHKEITLPELREMANPMKEYLVPQNAGGFMYKKAYESKSIPNSWIEIPDGAIRARFYPNDPDALEFEGDFCQWWHDKDNAWINYENYSNTLEHSRVVWQRDQAEPFLTPECTLNDQYAEIEQVRQVEIHGTVKAAQAGGGVDATLTERQSQYGCYEDVAHVTQQILSVLRIGNYDELPAPMKESLHMIASKMARIVNGDPEYLDNWHDIGGYAKLIEKLIEGN